MTANNSSATRSAQERVRISLSQEQVDEIARQLLRQGSHPDPDNGLEHPGESIAVWAKSPMMDDRRLSRSVLIGLLTLACFAPGGERRLVDIAELLDLPPSSIHRYVRTLLAAGLLEQIPHTREYRLRSGAGAPGGKPKRAQTRPPRTKDTAR